MGQSLRAVKSVTIVLAALVAVATPSVAVAQQAGRPATAAPQPERGQSARQYPGVRTGGGERRPSQYRNSRQSPRVVYVPVPVSIDYYGSPHGYGNVYDANGRPLADQHERAEAYATTAHSTLSFQAYTPDLSGSPYVVLGGGAMVVDFGEGRRITVPSCAATSAAGTPDNQPRTVFYRPPSDGIVFRAGHTGRVRGSPPGGASVCYASDAYGRTELRY